MDKELKDGLDLIQGKIDKFQEKYDQELKEAGKVAAETKAELEQAHKEYTEEMKSIYNIQQEQLDKIEKAHKDLRDSGFSARGAVSLKDAFAEMLEKSDEWEAQKKNERKFANMELKVVANMTTTASFTGQVDGYTRNETIIPQLLRTTHIRSLFPQGTMTGSHYEIIRNTGGEGGPTYVAEAGAKPQQDEDFALVQIPAAKIAAFATLTEEMLEDTQGLASFMATKMIGDVRRLEDTKLLYGTGSGDITGISQFTSVIDLEANPYTSKTISSASIAQALIAARVTMAKGNVGVGAFLVGPETYGALLSDLSTGGADVAMNYSFEGSLLRVAGIPLIETTAITNDDVFAINPEFATVFQRKGIMVSTSNEHASNFTSNLVTMLVEERLAFVPWREEAFGFGGVDAIITALAS